jgi:hypothetical protein
MLIELLGVNIIISWIFIRKNFNLIESGEAICRWREEL